jgi:hypothetical protein
MLKSSTFKIFMALLALVAIGFSVLPVGGWVFGRTTPTTDRMDVPGPGEASVPAQATSVPTLAQAVELADTPSAPRRVVRREEVLPPKSTEVDREALSSDQLEQLREITSRAQELAATFEDSDYQPPEIPPDLEQKLGDLSPELLELIRIIVKMPPAHVSGTAPSGRATK